MAGRGWLRLRVDPTAPASTVGSLAVVVTAAGVSLGGGRSEAAVAIWLTGFAILGFGFSILSGGRASWGPSLAGLAVASVLIGVGAAVAVAFGLVETMDGRSSWAAVGGMLGGVVFILGGPVLAVGLVLGGLISEGRTFAQHLRVAAGGSLRTPSRPLTTVSVARQRRKWPSATPTLGVLASAVIATAIGVAGQATLAVAALAGGSFASGFVSASPAVGARGRRSVAVTVVAFAGILALLWVAGGGNPEEQSTRQLVADIAGPVLLVAAAMASGLGVASLVRWRLSAIEAPILAAPESASLDLQLAAAIADGAATRVIRRYPSDAEDAMLAADAFRLERLGYDLDSVVRQAERTGRTWRAAAVAALILDLLTIPSGLGSVSASVAEHRQAWTTATFVRRR